MGFRSLLTLFLATGCQALQTESSGFVSAPFITTVDHSSSGGGSTGTSSLDPGGTSTGSSGDSSAGSTGSDPASTTSPLLDVGSVVDLGDGKPVGCAGKIDFLFVISRDASMNLVQTQLIEAFPEFIATIQERFVDFDYHIMVVDGGDNWGGDFCNANCTPQGCPGHEDYPCDKMDLVTECDQTLGAGTVFPAGYNAANRPCDVGGGQRFLTSQQPELAETFECIAKVGSSGRRWLGEALMAAMSPPLNWKDSCNEGFLRKDALLMVTLLSAQWDEEGKPNGSAGTAEQWAKAVVDAKKGDANAIVMLDIGDLECPQPADRLCVMTKKFPFHHIEDIEAPSYKSAFDAASDLVEEACAGFVVPG